MEKEKLQEYINQLVNILLTAPDTGELCEICSDIRTFADGMISGMVYYSFDVRDARYGTVWTHNIITYEAPNKKSNPIKQV